MTIAPVDERNNRPPLRLVLAPLLGPVTWSIFFLAGYLLAEAACQVGLLQSTVAGLDLLVFVVLVLGLVAAAVSAAGALWAYRRWRTAGDQAPEEDNLTAFLALAAILLNVLFTLATLMTALGLIFLEPCSWT
ncbi:MAG: hypothetical protein RRC07_07570 [Anaerolineae bacterium]|nr:hypothetical protein [Anaerolineae bacterium]